MPLRRAVPDQGIAHRPVVGVLVRARPGVAFQNVLGHVGSPAARYALRGFLRPAECSEKQHQGGPCVNAAEGSEIP